MLLIDTHCHLDASEFDHDREDIICQSSQYGLGAIIIPSVHRENFETVKRFAHQWTGGFYAMGIHPLYVPQSNEEDLAILETQLQEALANQDDRLVAVGEIGLDFFVPELKEWREKQIFFYQAQLKLAKRYDLPVLLHVRRSQDLILKYLRQIDVTSGIAHAFNGSDQQAKAFIERGFCLGFGGVATFERSQQIRRLLQSVPLENIVLETDAPDLSPAWLAPKTRNSPLELPRIAQTLSSLRGISLEDFARQTTENAQRLMPSLRGIKLS